MDIVRAKLYLAFSKNEGDGAHRIMDQLYPEGITYEEVWVPFRDGITAQKVLRLGFHDCMRYQDGSGGCDGCINWSGMGERYSSDNAQLGLFERGGDDHNNGLRATVEVLEEMYTNASFPRRAPALEQS